MRPNVLTSIKKNISSRQMPQNIAPGAVIMQSAEVFDIILDDTHIDYIDESSIGIIKFKFISSNNISLESSLNSAKPYDPNDIKYPLKHEIVLIISAPAASAGVQNDARCFYYMNPIGIWGLINHNALPYASTLPQSKLIKFGKYFKESPEFAKLEPQEGDKIISGRFGNYIRLTSTQTNSNKPWNIGANNSPIIILSCDNTTSNKKVEDINSDASSIYISQDAKLGLKSSFTNYKSYTKAPDLDYKGAQIILNSDRIHLNSKKDHILLTSEKTVSIAGKNEVHIDSGGNIIIGDTSKAFAIPLGDPTNTLLTNLSTAIQALATVADTLLSGAATTAVTPFLTQINQTLSSKQNLSTQVYSS